MRHKRRTIETDRGAGPVMPSGLSRLYRHVEHKNGHIARRPFYTTQKVGVASHVIAQCGKTSNTRARATALLAAVNTPDKLRRVARACGQDA
jgi:hypothetical protein